MGKNILVIGGTGALGALLVQQLLDAGHAVAVASRGRTTDGFGAQVRRIHADRHDRAAMHAAFAEFAQGAFDVVIDLLNRSPLDAHIALDVFKGKTRRYVMASSLTVYRHRIGTHGGPFAEDALDLTGVTIDAGRDWHDPVDARENFAPGLLQAEAAIFRDGGLPAVSVRLAHVLGDTASPHDPLAYYVALAQSGQALLYANGKATTSFIDIGSAASFLHWSAMQAYTGPVNAASTGQLSALGLQRRVAEVLGVKARALPLSTQGNLSPFDLPHPLLLDTARAAQLGYRFNRLDGWLDLLIHQYQPDLVSAPGTVPGDEAPAQVPPELLSACKPRRPSLQTSLSAAG